MIQGANLKESEAARDGLKKGSLKKKAATPIVLRLTRRGVTFLFLLLIAVICFYSAGCIQQFLDSDITLLLFCITSISILLALFSVAAIAECLIFLFYFKRVFFLVYAVPFLIISVIAVMVAIVSNSTNMLAGGV